MFNRLLFFGDILLSRWIKAKMHHATTKTAYTIPIIDHCLVYNAFRFVIMTFFIL